MNSFRKFKKEKRSILRLIEKLINLIEPIIIEKWATKSHLFKEGEKLVRLWFKKDFRAWYPRGSVLQIRSDEIDGATPFALHRTARYEHDKRIPGKSTVRFAIGSSISKSKASDLFLPLSLSILPKSFQRGEIVHEREKIIDYRSSSSL